MKTGILIAATLAAYGFMNAAHAGSLDSPWDEPEITVIPCPTYGVLWGAITWELCPNGLANSFRDYDDESRPVPSDFPKADKPKADKPKADKPKADKPKADKPKADKKPKRNASENNGKGGNDGKGGKPRDGSKNPNGKAKKNR